MLNPRAFLSDQQQHIVLGWSFLFERAVQEKINIVLTSEELENKIIK